MRSGRPALVALAAALTALAVGVGAASSSERIGLDATDVRLSVSSRGALVTFREDGRLRRVLASGAINARPPSPHRAQVAFDLDFSPARALGSGCGRYDGPALHWLVAACKAPDGSYWALQRWQRMLPNYGVRPTARQAAWELRLSHWRGPLAVLEIGLDWSYAGRFDHLYGSLTYLGRPVHGFRTTSRGETLDPYGRNVYVDTFNSAYGRGWQRENSFVAHRPTGTFCYGFVPHGGRPAGKGQAYRATVIGPGVLPDAFWQGPAFGRFSAARELAANTAQRRMRDALCAPN